MNHAFSVVPRRASSPWSSRFSRGSTTITTRPDDPWAMRVTYVILHSMSTRNRDANKVDAVVGAGDSVLLGVGSSGRTRGPVASSHGLAVEAMIARGVPRWGGGGSTRPAFGKTVAMHLGWLCRGRCSAQAMGDYLVGSAGRRRGRLRAWMRSAGVRVVDGVRAIRCCRGTGGQCTAVAVGQYSTLRWCISASSSRSWWGTFGS